MAEFPLQNINNLSSDLLESLAKELRPLTDFQAGIAEELLQFVVDGTSESSVLNLAGFDSAASALGLSSTGRWGDKNVKQRMKERALLLRPENAESVPADFWLRLAQLYSAARKTETGQPTKVDYWPVDLEYLLREIVAASELDPRGRQSRPRWTCDELVELWAAAGSDAEALMTGFLDPVAQHSLLQGAMLVSPIGGMKVADGILGIPGLLAQYPTSVASMLTNATADRRVGLLNELEDYRFDFVAIVGTVVELAVGTAKTVREVSAKLLTKVAESARESLEAFLRDGDAGQRNEAAAMLWRLFGPPSADVLLAHAENEKSKRVVRTIRRLTASESISTEPVASTENASTDNSSTENESWPPRVDPVNIPLGEVELTPIGREGVAKYLADCHAKASSEHERAVERFNRPDRPQWMTKPREPSPLGEQQVKEVLQFIEGKSKSLANRGYWRQLCHFSNPNGPWFKPPHFELVHTMRLQYAMGHVEAGRRGQDLHWFDTQTLEAYRANCEQRFGMRELDQALTSLPRFEPGDAMRGYLGADTDWMSFCDWEPEAIWPAFVDQLEMLKGYFGPSPNRSGNYINRDYSWPYRRRNAFRVLGMFPQVPPGFVSMLWELALGESKTDRPLAQSALATVEGRVPRSIDALTDGKQAIRAAAAEWLAELGDTSAIEPLKQVFRKEKQEVVKAALMIALEKLGADVGEFLDRDQLSKQAEAGLKKKPPKGMEWVPLAGYPQLTWEDNNKAVSPEVIRWWIVQSVKQKNPACNPLMRRYLSLCRQNEAAEFGYFVLSTWINYDSQTLSHDEAMEQAKLMASNMWKTFGASNWAQTQYKHDINNLTMEIYQTKTHECLNSAIGQKGMLSIVSAVGDRRCVALAEQYIRRWYGQRAAQCKALLEVLSWLDDPLAIQVLLSIANRFRTKSIQKAAHEYVQELAERQGWTVEQLADRTIPDGGFQREQDEQGLPIGEVAKLVVDYGSRTFEIQLDDELKPVISKEDGKTVKNLPAPAKDDDEELVKAAKKAYTTAKKTVKEVVKRQTERLYEAMCTAREWPLEDWQRYIAWHPIVGKLCCQLVWLLQTDDDSTISFRPLEDGTYTNVDDESIELPVARRVRVAHTCCLTPEVANAWRTHLEDYDVAALFPQFRQEVYVLSDDKKNARSLDDFEGYMSTAFKLRSGATKLGYVRGEIEDGACFVSYHKYFLSLEIQAVLEFTGSFVPEEDISVALTNLSFATYRPNSPGTIQAIPLQKIPPVLLSECYNDIKQIADAGGGYDVQWQSKSYM